MASPKEKLIAEASKLAEKGQYERAVKVYLKVVADDDKDVRVWLNIGDLYTKLRRNREAAETYQRVAQFYNDQGFYKKAIAVHKQILKLDPSMVEVHGRLAELYKQMGILPDAIEHYSAVAAHHQSQGDMRQALQAIKQIVELDPQNVSSRVKLAEMYSKEQMGREAIEEFAKAAEHLHEQGRLDDYMKVAERLLFHSPDNRPVSRELARLYLRKGDARRALPRLQVCFKADPRDTETLVLLADAFEALRQDVKAVSVLKELARIHGENGSIDERDHVYRRVLQLAPGDTEIKAALESGNFASSPGSMPSFSPSSPSSAPSFSPSSPGSMPSFSPSIASAPLAAPVPSDVVDPHERTPTGIPAVAVAVAHRSSRTGVAAAPPELSGPHSGPKKVPVSAPASAPKLPVAVAFDEEEVAKILAETDVFMKYNLQTKALEHVKTVFEKLPDHIGAREKLRSLYLALGRNQEAIEELRILAEQTAGSPAEVSYVKEILRYAPGDEWAAERLLSPSGAGALFMAAPVSMDLPIEIDLESDGVEEMDAAEREAEGDEQEVDIDEIEFSDESLTDATQSAALAMRNALGGPRAMPSSDEEFPMVVESGQFDGSSLPPVEEDVIEDRFGADLDEPEAATHAAEALATEMLASPDRQPAAAPANFLFEAADVSDNPEPPDLPALSDVDNFDFSSFVESAPVAGSAPFFFASTTGPAESIASAATIGIGGSTLTPGVFAPISLSIAAAAVALDDELDEADFYMQQGLVDEARDALQGLLARHPAHPLVLGKLRELESGAIANGRSEAPLSSGPAPTKPGVAILDQDPDHGPELAFDEPVESAHVQTSTARRNVVEVGVNDDDFESHFDLGIAYKEMGLVDDAITEFKLVMRDPTRQVQCHQMLGLCLASQGKMNDAISHFKQGLYAEGIQDDEEFSLYYELGQAYEKIRDTAEAIYYYERISKRRPRYRDVERRLHMLAPSSTAATSTTDDFASPADQRKS